MAGSKWQRWARPVALVVCLFSLSGVGYWVWQMATRGPSFLVLFQLIGWLLLTAVWTTVLVRGRLGWDWDSHNPHAGDS